MNEHLEVNIGQGVLLRNITPLTREKAYQNILEWLYISDGQFEDKASWRRACLEMIEWNLKKIL